MPTIIDTENNPHYVVQQLPSFIKYQNGKYLIHAKFPAEEIGYHLIRGIITDSQLSTPFKFRVQVFNDPPDFETPLVDQITYLGEKSQYLLPQVVENEGLKYSVVAKLEDGRALPSFIKIAKKQLIFNIPDDLALVNTEYKLNITLDDGYSIANRRLIVVKIKSPQDKVGRDGEAFIAALEKVSMTRDQLLTLRVVGAKGSENLINKLDADSFNIRVND